MKIQICGSLKIESILLCTVTTLNNIQANLAEACGVVFSPWEFTQKVRYIETRLVSADSSPFLKASDTLGDFIRRSPRSAKIARCARYSDCDFRRSPRSAFKIADIWHVRYRRLNSAIKFVIFYVYCCQSPVKPTHQVGRFYHISFQNCHIAAIGEKNRQVCPNQSPEKIACDFRWRSNSPRSAYKIARCVADLSRRHTWRFCTPIAAIGV